MNEETHRTVATNHYRRSFLFHITMSFLAVLVVIGSRGLLGALSPTAPSLPERWATTVQLNALEPGKPLSIVSNGTPVFVLKLTDNQLREAHSIEVADLADPRARNPNLLPDALATVDNRTFEANGTFLVVEGVCGALGYVATFGTGDFDAWFCPGRGGHFDILGRVHRGPDLQNMRIPKYRIVASEQLMLVDWDGGISEEELDRLLLGTSQQKQFLFRFFR